MRNYVGIVRDHSGSMSNLTKSAILDYNQLIASLKSAGQVLNVDTVVSVITCGGIVQREIVNAHVDDIRTLTRYPATGGTPLFESVGELITIFEGVADKDQPDVAFLIMPITDGEDNQSPHWPAPKLRKEMERLQATDRWSFAFRVPKGHYKRALVHLLGVSEGNVLEWEQTEKGFAEATQVTTAAIQDYYRGRQSGRTSTDKFFPTMQNLSPQQVQRELVDVSSQVMIWTVTNPLGDIIKSFCERKSGRPYMKGRAFYQITKPETVQMHKELAIQDKASGAVYTGDGLRGMLNLPVFGSIKLVPAMHPKYDLFVQSTSVNRILPPGVKVMYFV